MMTPKKQASEAADSVKFSRRLTVAAILSGCAGAALMAWTNNAFLGSFLLFGAVGLLTTRALVRRSMMATAGGRALEIQGAQRLLARPGLDRDDFARRLSKCKFLEKVETEGQKAADLAAELLRRAKFLGSLLDQKFEEGEITKSRYRDAVEGAVHALSDQLVEVENRLNGLNAGPGVGSEFEDGRKQVRADLERVSAGLQHLGQLHEELNKIVTRGDQRDQLEERLADIQELARRAAKYSKGSST